MNNISPLATVHPGAKLGDNIEIGPYAFIDDNVEIGDGCKIYPHATIFPYVKMGCDCNIFPGAVIGAIPYASDFIYAAPIPFGPYILWAEHDA